MARVVAVVVAGVVLMCCVVLDAKLISNRLLAFVVPVLSIILGTIALFSTRASCQNQVGGLTSLKLWWRSGGVVAGLKLALAIGACIVSIAMLIDLAPAYSVAWRGVGISILGMAALIMAGGYLGAVSSFPRQ